MSYTQHHTTSRVSPSSTEVNDLPSESLPKHGTIRLQELTPSLALEDEVLKDVRAAWERITADDGDARGRFLLFEDREGLGGGDDDYGDDV